MELPRRSKNALYAAFTAAGIVAGLVGRDIINGPQPIPSVRMAEGSEPEPTQGVLYEATIAADVYNMLHPSPTPTSTPYPTSTPSPDPLKDRTFCTESTQGGELCKVPYPPPPTPTPYPSCDSTDLTPGDWCIMPKGVS